MSGAMRLSTPGRQRLLKRLRTVCLSFPETSERPSHGESAFFFKKKRSFANTDTYHHGADHYAAWIAAPVGAQDILVRSDPKHYFVPPYVGHRGWIGVTLDNDPDWDEVERIVGDAYALVASPRVKKPSA